MLVIFNHYRACEQDVIHIDQKDDHIITSSFDKKAGIHNKILKTIINKPITQLMIPDLKCLLQTI